MSIKRIMQVAKECGVRYNDVFYAVKKLGVIPEKTGRTMFLNKHQEDMIHEHLFAIGKTDALILESKMNTMSWL